jgi:hypothetical protein
VTWFLPSLGRANRMRQFIASYRAAQETVDVKVLLASWDSKLEEYKTVDFPAHWEVVHLDEVHCGPTHNAAFARWPNEKCYGLIDDDVLIKTPHGLSILEEAAGDYYISYGEDGFHSSSYTVMPCIGGELARLCGFVLTPGVLHNGCEGAWNDLGRKFGLLRFQSGVLLEHMHPFFNKGERDETYEHGEKASRENQGAYDRWVNSNYSRLAEKVGNYLKEMGHAFQG